MAIRTTTRVTSRLQVNIPNDLTVTVQSFGYGHTKLLLTSQGDNESEALLPILTLIRELREAV